MLPEPLPTPLRAQNRELCVKLKPTHLLKQWIKFAIYHEIQQDSNYQKASAVAYSFQVREQIKLCAKDCTFRHIQMLLPLWRANHTD